MFTTIQIQYLSEPERVGGRPGSVETTYEVDSIWDGNTSKKRYNQRLLSVGIDVEASILFEEDMPFPNPGSTRVVKDGVVYDVVEVDEPPSDIGLEGTYTLLLNRKRIA